METLNLKEAIIFLAAAGILVPLIWRFRISPVLGYLIVGIIIGPYGLARLQDDIPALSLLTIADLEGTRLLAELGVVFLLFMIGLELSIPRLWAMRRLVFGLGGAQVLVTGTAITLIALAFGHSGAAAMILGAALALSSTAIVMQLLTEHRRLGTAMGRMAFSILLFQDLAVLPVLLMVGVFASKALGSPIYGFLLALAQAGITIAVILVFGRLIIRPIFRYVGATASKEMFLALVLLVILGTATVTHIVGLSMALGAFLAGLLFAETEYRQEIEVNIEPFKGLLLGLFFVSVGMGIDPFYVISDPFIIIISVVGLFLVKALILYILARLFKEAHAVAVEGALILGQGGEFAFIVISVAVASALIPGNEAQFFLAVTSLSMMATPIVALMGRHMARFIEQRQATAADGEIELSDDIEGHVIIAGYGRVGQLLGKLLETQEIPHIGLDADAVLIAGFRSEGASVFYGDASRGELLNRFHVQKAAALVVTMDNPAAAERIVKAARHQCPDLPILARARDQQHARTLQAIGASQAIPETVEASLQLGETVLMNVGFSSEAARQLVEVKRQEERALLNNQMEE